MEPRERTFAEVVTGRRSVTAWTGEVVSQDLVRDIVAEATLAPSAFNGQPWRFVVVQGDALDDLGDALGGNHAKVTAAGTLVAVFADTADVVAGGPKSGFYDGTTARTQAEFAARNGSLAAMTLMLAAWSHGVGTRPMIGFDADGLADLLGVPDTWHPVLVVAMGWPGDEPPAPRQRRPLGEVLRFV